MNVIYLYLSELTVECLMNCPVKFDSFPQRCSVITCRPGLSLALYTMWMSIGVTPLLLFQHATAKEKVNIIAIYVFCFINIFKVSNF